MDPKKAAKKARQERLVERWNRAIAAVLSATRRDLDLTQEALAERLTWSRDQVANVEAGRRIVQAAEIPLFAQAFGMEAEALFRRILRWQV